MLSKRRRITRHDFPPDSREGRVFHAPHLSLRVTSSGTTTARVSVVVSKKVAAKSVDRHLIKRRVYDSVSRGGLLPAARYVFFAKASAHTVSFRELQEEVQKLLRDAKSLIVKPTRVV